MRAKKQCSIIGTLIVREEPVRVLPRPNLLMMGPKDILAQRKEAATGYAVLTYVIYAPGGGGTIPLYPAAVVRRERHAVVLKHYEDTCISIPTPPRHRAFPLSQHTDEDRSPL